MPDQYLSIGEASEYLGVSIDTLRRWEKKGKVTSTRVNGKDRHFLLKDLEKLKFEDTLNVGEAAKRLPMSASTLRRLSDLGQIKFTIASNGYRRYTVKDLEEFLSKESKAVQKALAWDVVHKNDAEEREIPSTRARILTLNTNLSGLKRFWKITIITGVGVVIVGISIFGIIAYSFINDPKGASEFFNFSYRENFKVLGAHDSKQGVVLGVATALLQEPAKVAVRVARVLNPEGVERVVLPEERVTAFEGLQGPQGEQGKAGLQGLKGEEGDTGATGEKGDTGSFSTNYSSSGGLNFNPYGILSGNVTEIRFYELYANGTEYVGFEAQDSIGASQIWKLPATDGTSGQCLTTDGADTLSFASCAASAVSTLNGLTGSTQTFATGNSGTDFSISSSGTTHTFNIPDAGASARGLVTTGAQTFAGIKSFSSNLNADGGFDVNDLFQVNSSGAVSAAAGITSSGTITFSGLTASRGVFTTTGGELTSSGLSQYLIDSLSDETGTGALVFGTSPTISTPTFATSATTPLLIGGTGTASTLTLRSTSGVGTIGADIIFQTGSNGATEALRILNNGNVGIGDVSPASLFTVGSGDLFQVNSSGAIAASRGITTNGLVTITQTDIAANMLEVHAFSGDQPLTIDENGNIGIYTPNPGYDLDIDGVTHIVQGLYLDEHLTVDNAYVIADGGLSVTVPDNFWQGLGASAGQIEFDDQTTDEINILNALVGIGTSTPSTVLDIAGSVTAAASGQVAGLNVSSTLTGRSNTSDVYYGVKLTPTMIAGGNTQTMTGLYVAPTYNDNSKTGVIHYDAVFNGDGDVVIGNNIKWSNDTGARLSVQDSNSAGAVNIDFRNSASVAVGNEVRLRLQNYGNQTDNNTAYISSIVTNAASGAGDLAFGLWSGGEVFRLQAGGNVGIGDTTPDAKLEVLGTGEQLRLTHTDGTVDARVTVDSSGNLTFDGSSDGTGSETLTLTGFSTLTASSLTAMTVADSFILGLGGSAGRIEFTDNSTDEVNILSANVGLGTSDPERKLHVVGGTNSGIFLKQGAVVDADSSNFYNGLVLQNPSSTQSYAIGYQTGDLFALNHFDSGSIYQNILVADGNSGYVGIGTSGVSPAGRLEIEDNGGTGLLIDQNGNGISLNIDAESTTADIVNIDGTPLTTGIALDVTNLDALTTGRGLNIYSNASNTSSRSLAFITNDNAAATGTRGLTIQQDSIGHALFVDYNNASGTSNNDRKVVYIDVDDTSATSGTDYVTGIDLDMDRSGATGGTTGMYGMQLEIYGSSSTDTVTGLYVDVNGSATTEYAAVFYGGKVGVGTDTPTNDLELWDTDADGDTHLFIGDSTPGSTAATAPCIKFGTTTTGEGVCNLSGDLVFFEGTANLGGEVARFQSGSFGIGDTGPDAKLEVLGTSEQLRLTYTDSTVDARISVDSSGHLTIDGSTDGTGSQTFTLTGYSTLTASSLTAMTIADNFYLGLGSGAGRIEFDDQTTDEVNILNANVGIGTSTPDEELQVNGDIHTNGAVYNTKKTFSYNPDAVSTYYTQYLGTFNVASGPVDITIRDTGWGHGSGSFFRVTRHYGSTPIVQLQNTGLNGSLGSYTIYYRSVDDDSYELFFDDADGSNGNTINYTVFVEQQAAVESDTISASNDTNVAAATVALVTNYSGNVGIGTASPADKLDVFGSSSQTRVRIGGTDATGRLVMAWDETNNEAYINSYDGSYQNIQFNANTLKVVGNSTNTMVLTGGDVGIGTSTPQSKLQVTGGGLCVGSDANCNTDNDTEGVVYSSATAMTVYDVAENYPTKDGSLVWGEIVALDVHNGVFVKRANDISQKIIGVISKEPAVLLGGFNGNQFKEEKQVAVGLSGRILVKVSLEGGAIAVGDELTLSSTPGIAKKAYGNEQIIGYALENYSRETSEGMIQFFIALDRAIESGTIVGLDSMNTDNLQIQEGSGMVLAAEDDGVTNELKDRIEKLETYANLTTAESASYRLWKVIDDTLFTGKVTFGGIAQFANKAAFKEQVEFNTDTVGTVPIPANATGVKVTFSKPFERAPIVNLTPIKNNASYALNDVNEQSFTITLNGPNDEGIVFNWTAFLSEGVGAKVEVLEKVEATPSPMPSVSPLPSSTPVVNIVTIAPIELGFVRVRKLPTTDSLQIGEVTSGNTYSHSGQRENDWYHIEYIPGQWGWVHSTYVLGNNIDKQIN